MQDVHRLTWYVQHAAINSINPPFIVVPKQNYTQLELWVIKRGRVRRVGFVPFYDLLHYNDDVLSNKIYARLTYYKPTLFLDRHKFRTPYTHPPSFRSWRWSEVPLEELAAVTAK